MRKDDFERALLNLNLSGKMDQIHLALKTSSEDEAEICFVFDVDYTRDTWYLNMTPRLKRGLLNLLEEEIRNLQKEFDEI